MIAIGKRAIPPAAILITFALIVLLISISTLYLVTQQAWIGARFAAPDNSEHGIVVKKVYKNSPADGVLFKGQRLLVISDGNKSISLDPLILKAPSDIPSYSLFNQSLAIQDEIWPLLQNNTVMFQSANGEWLTLQPQASWPLRAIPAPFWLYAPISAIGLLFAMFIWLQNPRALASWFLLFANWIVFLTLNESILLDRELAHTAQTMRVLAALENFGTNFFFPCFMGLFLVYPQKIASAKVALSVLLIAVLIPFNSTFQWIEIPVQAYMFHFLITAMILVTIMVFQWRKSRHSPLKKNQLKLIYLWMFLPFTFPFFLFAVPTAFNLTPFLTIEWGRVAVGGVGLGLALGILFHGLFDVEKWIINFALWFSGGVLVLLIDVLVASILHIQPVSALTYALLISGLIYFPLRQKLLIKLRPDTGKSVQAMLPTFAKQMHGATTPEEFTQRWQAMLLDRFAPATSKTILVNAVTSTQLSEGGLSLLTPSLNNKERLKITGKNNGSRLFNQQDIDFVQSLFPLTKILHNACDLKRKTQVHERSCIMNDLKHTLGKKIKTLVDTAPGETELACADNALTTLDEIVDFSIRTEPILYVDLANDWRKEFSDRLNGIRVRSGWKSNFSAKDGEISTLKSMILTHILRESVTNALKHAQPDLVVVRIYKHPKNLTITISNNGNISNPEKWHSCSGLNGMRSRIHVAGGKLDLNRVVYKKQTFLQVKVVMPIPS